MTFTASAQPPQPTQSPQQQAPMPARGQTRTVAVVAESTCCLPPELARDLAIGIIPIPFVFGEETYLDGVDITPAEFYRKLIAASEPPKTSPPAPGAYLEAWRQAAGSIPGGADVVSVTVDGKISTLQRSARLALELAPESLPGVGVRVVDSLSAGMGQGFVALAAARAARAGRTFEEVVAIAERVSRRVRLVVTLDTLEYLARASRIPQVAALLGGILAIKPIILIAEGDIHPLARVRGRRHALDQLVEHLRGLAPPGARLHAAVQHARAEEEAAWLEARIRAMFDCAEVYTTEFTPVMGGYCGPGLLGVAFYCEDADAGG
jgi:DegV family protein with EDD domain